MYSNNTELTLLSEVLKLKDRLDKSRAKSRDQHMVQAAQDSNVRNYPQSPTLNAIFNLRAHTSKVYDALWTPTDQFVLTVGGEGLILVWEATSGLIHNVLDVAAIKPVTAAASGDARIVFCGGLCANVVLFNSRHESAEDGYSVYENSLVYEHSGQVNSINRISDTQLLTSTPLDGALLWDVERVKITGRFIHPLAAVECVTLSSNQSDSPTFLTGTNDGVIWFWDLRQPNKPSIIFEGHESTVNCIRPLPNGYSFVTGSDDTSIHLYDTRTDLVLGSYSDPYLPINLPSMESDATMNGLEDGIPITLAGVCDLAVSSSGRLILSGCRDSCVYYWDMAQTDRCIHHVMEPGPVVRLSMSNKKTALLMMTWDAKSRVRIMRPR